MIMTGSARQNQPSNQERAGLRSLRGGTPVGAGDRHRWRHLRPLLACLAGLLVMGAAASPAAWAEETPYDKKGVSRNEECVALKGATAILRNVEGNQLYASGQALTVSPDCGNGGVEIEGIKSVVAKGLTLYLANPMTPPSGFVARSELAAAPNLNEADAAENGKAAPAEAGEPTYRVTPAEIAPAMCYLKVEKEMNNKSPLCDPNYTYEPYGLPIAGAQFTDLAWSWVDVGSGGIARATVSEGEDFYPANVNPIGMNSVNAAGNPDGGRVTARYGYVSIPGAPGASGPTKIYGWLATSHTGLGGECINHMEFVGGGGPLGDTLCPGPTASSWAVENPAGNVMNVVYENTVGQLKHAYWGESGGWHEAPETLASGIVGTPAVVENAADVINALYETTGGQLKHAYEAENVWHEESEVLASGIAGPPAVVLNSAGNVINALYETTGGQLKHAYWGEGAGWHNAPEVLASGLVGPPTVVENNAGTQINAFYETTGGQLKHAYEAENVWHEQAEILGTGMVGVPTVVENKAGTQMNVFYETTGGQLKHSFWAEGSGWHESPEVLATGVAGPPAVVENNAGTQMNVFYATTGGQLKHIYWGEGSGWHEAPEVLGSGIVGTPSAVENAANVINVFYETTGGQLKHSYYSESSGWHEESEVLASGLANP